MVEETLRLLTREERAQLYGLLKSSGVRQQHVSKHLGIDPSRLSYMLSGKFGVGPDFVDDVERAVKELGKAAT